MAFKEAKVLAKIVLAGFMGAGKTTVGRVLSALLGVPFVDTDAIIEERYGAIPDIFARKGEAFFRKVEEEVTSEVLDKSEDCVISVGGGALTSQKTLKSVLSKSVPVYLKCRVEACFDRAKGTNRPLAKDFASFKKLFYQRKPVYEQLLFFVETDETAPELIARQIKALVSKTEFNGIQKILFKAEPLSDTAKRMGQFVITDRNVFSIYGGVARGDGEEFYNNRFSAGTLYGNLFSGKNTVVIEPGERSKTLETVKEVYEKLLSLRISREDVLSYVGGGVVGDIAGLVSATILRGVPLRAFPTTLLSIVDSAIGGKNGVNFKGVKNMIGTFYIPTLTVINPAFLSTLPEKEVLNGMGEVFKYALLSENGIFEDLEKLFSSGANGTGGVNGAGGAQESGKTNFHKSVQFPDILKRSISEKLLWIEGDLTDTKGKRAFLNLGHTAGHLVEKLTNFSVPHGEAVTFGIIVSAFYALKNSLLKSADFERICALYKGAGFDFSSVSRLLKEKGVEVEELRKVLYADKKRIGEKVLWILPVRFNRSLARKIEISEIEKTILEVLNENPCN